MRRAIACAVVFLAVGCALPRPPVRWQRPAPRWNGRARSGLMMVVFQDPTPGRFELAISYGAGASTDPAGKEGLAELTRRLTERVRAGGAARPDRFDRLYATGAETGSQTFRDGTVFQARGPDQALEAVLDVERERLLDPLADTTQDDVEAVRDQMLRGDGAPFPGEELWQAQRVVAAALNGHPASRPIFGTPESLRSIRLEDVQRLAADRFRPANTIVVVSTPMSPRAAADRVAARLTGALSGEGAEWVEPELAPPPPPVPVPVAAPQLIRAEPASAPRLWLAWAAPGWAADASGNTVVAAGVALAAAEVRLRRPELAKRILRLQTHLEPAADFSLALLGVDLTVEADAPAVLMEVAEALRDDAAGAAGREDLGAMMERVLAGNAGARPDLGTVAAMVRAGYGADHVAAIRALFVARISAEEVQGAVRRHFGPERMHRFLFVPTAAASRGPGLPFAPPVRDPAPGPAFEPPDAAAAAALLGAAGEPESRRTLPGGLEVRVVRRPHSRQTVTALVIRPAPEDLAAGRKLPALALQASRLPGEARGCTGPHATFSTGRAFARYLRTWARASLPALRCTAAQTAVDEVRFDAARDRLVEELRKPPPAPQLRDLAEQAICRLLLPGGQCGERADPEAVAALTAAQGREWLASRLRPDRAVLLLAANPELEKELDPLIDQHFADWTSPAGPAAPEAEAPLAARSHAIILAVPGAPDARFEVAVRARDARDPVALIAVAIGLDEELARASVAWPGARTRNDLLEYRTGSAVRLTAFGSRGSVGGLVESFQKALAEARTSAPEARAAARVRWILAHRLYSGRATEDRSDEFLAWAAGTTRWPADLAADVAALGPERIRAAAATLAADRMVVVAVGDPDALTTQLRAAGFEVEVVRPPAKSAPQ